MEEIKKISWVRCLSNNTVKRGIEAMAKNIEETLIHRIQKSFFFHYKWMKAQI
jgi:hypothetical protein